MSKGGEGFSGGGERVTGQECTVSIAAIAGLSRIVPLDNTRVF